MKLPEASCSSTGHSFLTNTIFSYGRQKGKQNIFCTRALQQDMTPPRAKSSRSLTVLVIGFPTKEPCFNCFWVQTQLLSSLIPGQKDVNKEGIITFEEVSTWFKFRKRHLDFAEWNCDWARGSVCFVFPPWISPWGDLSCPTLSYFSLKFSCKSKRKIPIEQFDGYRDVSK